MDSIDWKALGVVYAGSSPKPRPTPEVNVVVVSIDSETELELAEERAAIMEFEGELSRVKAEACAFRNIKRSIFLHISNLNLDLLLLQFAYLNKSESVDSLCPSNKLTMYQYLGRFRPIAAF